MKVLVACECLTAGDRSCFITMLDVLTRFRKFLTSCLYGMMSTWMNISRTC